MSTLERELGASGTNLRLGLLTLGLACCLSTMATPLRSASDRNLVLITIDTLRADHLGCNGSQKVRTPHLDRLAREGVNFSRARSPVPLTLPAHASILTGNYPPTHTVRSNGEYVLPDSQVSLAEVLAAQGYRTAAFVSSFVLDRRFGLAQGFGHYDDRVWSNIEEIEQLEAERTADQTFERFAAWLAVNETDRPSFVWIHLYDPHAPYEPPEPFRSEYPEEPYAGEVAFVDSIVGRILAWLDDRGMMEDSLIAVAGDHGEGLGEHGEQTHSLLIYNSTLHVPLILWGRGVVPQGGRIDNLVRLIDLPPTLLDYLGLEPALGEGVSLRPLIEQRVDETPPEALTAYSESLYPELALGWSPLRGLEGEVYKLILAPTPELYAMDEDPKESHNRVEPDAGAYQRMKRQMVDTLAGFEEAGDSATTEGLDAETRARLESLGYVSSSGSSAHRQGSPTDPKEGVGLWNRIQLGIAQLGKGDAQAAASTFESVLAADPDIPLVYEYLGTCWQRASRLDRAESVYRRALEIGIESPRLHHELGRILRDRGETEAAERELQVALALDPHSVGAHFDLANLLRTDGRLGLALEHYERAVELSPDYLWAWNGLAMSLAAQGRMHEATAAFRRVVEIAPDSAPGLFNLAVHLERMGERSSALDAYRRFLEIAPADDYSAQRRQAESAITRLGGN